MPKLKNQTEARRARYIAPCRPCLSLWRAEGCRYEAAVLGAKWAEVEVDLAGNLFVAGPELAVAGPAARRERFDSIFVEFFACRGSGGRLAESDVG